MGRTKPGPKAKRGAKIKKINWRQFEKLCQYHCTLSEIAGILSMSEDTVETRCKEYYGENFSDVYKKKAAKGKMSIRRSQFALAKSANPTMLIWLGKQWLNQTDKIENKTEITSDQLNDLLISWGDEDEGKTQTQNEKEDTSSETH